MVGEVGFTEDVQPLHVGHEVVVHPQAAHRVVGGGIDHHGRFMGIVVCDFLVHVEQVAVLAVNPFAAHALDFIRKVQEDALAGDGYAAAVVAGFLGGAGGDVARSQVAEGGVLAFQVVIAFFFGNVGRLDFLLADFFRGFTGLGHPDAAAVAEGFRHQRQLGLVVALDRNAGGVNLREAGVGEEGAALVGLVGGGDVAAHRVGGQEEDVAVAARAEQDGVPCVGLDFTGDQVAGDDAPGFAVHQHQVHHFMAGEHFNVSLGHFLFQGLVGAQQELLARLAACVEGALELGAAEGAVVQQAAVFTAEGNALGHALVNDVGGNFRQAVDVGFTGAEVAALHGVIEQAVDGVAVVLVVLGRVDAALGRNGVGAAGAVLVAEALDVVAKLGKRGGGGGAGQAGPYHEHGVLALVVRVDQFGLKLVLGPFVLNRAGRNLGIRHPVAYGKINHDFERS